MSDSNYFMLDIRQFDLDKIVDLYTKLHIMDTRYMM